MKIDRRYAQVSDTSHGCGHTQIVAIVDDSWQMIECTQCKKRWSGVMNEEELNSIVKRMQDAALDASPPRAVNAPSGNKSCTDPTPRWFVGHWREWHRGHGCDRDDGKPRSDAATTEVEQHEANTATGFLTDAELGFLRASTTSGNDLLCRALDELAARRSAGKADAK